jgi:hypothetical protein
MLLPAAVSKLRTAHDSYSGEPDTAKQLESRCSVTEPEQGLARKTTKLAAAATAQTSMGPLPVNLTCSAQDTATWWSATDRDIPDKDSYV